MFLIKLGLGSVV